MAEETHTLHVLIHWPDAWASYQIKCSGTTVERACATHYDHSWPDEFTCRCEDDECMCRQGDHGGCSEFGGYIEEVGDSCRAMPRNECWYEQMMDEVGAEAFDFGRDGIKFSLPIKLTGCSFDEPIEISRADA